MTALTEQAKAFAHSSLSYNDETQGAAKHLILELCMHIERQRGFHLPAEALNEPQLATMERALDHARRARWTNMTVRKDGVETTYEADWIKHMQPVGFDWPKSAIPAAKG